MVKLTDTKSPPDTAVRPGAVGGPGGGEDGLVAMHEGVY